MTAATISQEAEILSRVIEPENPNFSADAARSMLGFSFRDSDIEEMNHLAAMARQGKLSPQEESSLNAYLLVGSLVDLMHSKARLSLKKHSA